MIGKDFQVERLNVGLELGKRLMLFIGRIVTDHAHSLFGRQKNHISESKIQLVLLYCKRSARGLSDHI